jgi:hypothetical protein
VAIPTTRDSRLRRITSVAAGFQPAAYGSCFIVAAFIHLATAALRLTTFLPFPQTAGFASYYAAGWSVRLGLSPYSPPPAFVEWLVVSRGLPPSPPAHYSTPLWTWALQPVTFLSFPVAATLWLLLSLLLAALCHILLLGTAGYSDRHLRAWTFLLTLTFGPLFLGLTLGQNSILLLLSALLVGRALSATTMGVRLLGLLLWLLAVAAKLYPLLWAGSWLLLRRWRQLLLAALLTITAFAAVSYLQPESNNEYWLDFLPLSTGGHAASPAIDDQSLAGFLARIGRGDSYAVPGLSPFERHEITWAFPWYLSAFTTWLLSALILLALGVVLLFPWIKGGSGEDPDSPQGLLYGLILFSLLLFPHMARYNHVLALPAMAWLWHSRRAARHVVLVAYLLFALSRLNHLWAIVLPSVPAALASGTGLFAVLLLLLALVQDLSGSSLHRAPRSAA